MTTKQQEREQWEVHKRSNNVAFRVLDRRIRGMLTEASELGVPLHVLFTTLCAWKEFVAEGMEPDIRKLCEQYGGLLCEDIETGIEELDRQDAEGPGKKPKRSIGG